MSQLSFDTHAAIRKLERAGCPAPQAEAVVAVVSQATGVAAQFAKDLEHIRLQVETKMATKDDLAALRAESKDDIAALRAESKDDIAALRAETQDGFSKLRAETQDGFNALGAETQDGFSKLRAETQDGLNALGARNQDGLNALRAETQDGLNDLGARNQSGLNALRAETQGDIAAHREDTAAGFARLNERLDQVKENMVTKGDLYHALWVQGGVLATLILGLAGMTLGFALYVLTGS